MLKIIAVSSMLGGILLQARDWTLTPRHCGLDGVGQPIKIL
jgi:hypothetical protein